MTLSKLRVKGPQLVGNCDFDHFVMYIPHEFKRNLQGTLTSINYDMRHWGLFSLRCQITRYESILVVNISIITALLGSQLEL